MKTLEKPQYIDPVATSIGCTTQSTGKAVRRVEKVLPKLPRKKQQW
jgi:hypothetical protein